MPVVVIPTACIDPAENAPRYTECRVVNRVLPAILQEVLQEPDLLFGPLLGLREPGQRDHVLADAAKLVALQALHVLDEVVHRLLRDGRVEHRRVGPFEQDVRVQRREQQRVDAEFRRDQREHRGPVGRLLLLRLRRLGHAQPPATAGMSATVCPSVNFVSNSSR